MSFSGYKPNVFCMNCQCQANDFNMQPTYIYINISMVGNLLKDQSGWCPLSDSYSLSALVESLLLLSSHLLEMVSFLTNSLLKPYFALRLKLNLRVSLRPSWIPAPPLILSFLRPLFPVDLCISCRIPHKCCLSLLPPFAHILSPTDYSTSHPEKKHVLCLPTQYADSKNVCSHIGLQYTLRRRNSGIH